jgi:hypothetical protein
VPGDQVHIVLGFPVPALADEQTFRCSGPVGEGRLAPARPRAQRCALVYHADCYRRAAFGQFIVEASTMPEHLDGLRRVSRLLHQQAEVIAPSAWSARNQGVRTLFGQEAPEERLERAAADLFALGRVRTQEELLAGIAAVGGEQVREAFAQMLDAGVAVGLAGKIAKGAEQSVARIAGSAQAGTAT